MAEKKKELGRRQLSLPVKIVIVLFAVIMALSMMLPSLAAFFSSSSSSTEEKTEQTEDQTTDSTETTESTESEDTETAESSEATEDSEAAETTEGGESAEATEGTENAEGTETTKAEATEDSDELIGGPIPDNNDTYKNYAETYTELIRGYEKKLEADPDNLAAILNLGQSYMSWGYSCAYAATTPEESEYSKRLIDSALEYFDRYLALHESKAVRVDKALCLYYVDKTDEAIAELEAFSEQEPDYPLVWANLGMLYDLMGQDEKANDAYKKAAETDPDNKYGAKEYANGRLIDLNSTVTGPADAGDASVDKISTAPESGLTSTLAKDSGVGF